MNRHLHIISDKVPWPTDNSIAIDTFYKIKELHKEGVKIHLHYFWDQQGSHPTELNQYCESIHAYTAKSISSDNAPSGLISLLNSDNHPVLMEGLSSIRQLSQISNTGRIVIIRMHNTPGNHFEKQSNHFIAKIFSRKLKNQMPGQLPPDCRYVFTNEDAANCFSSKNNLPAINYLPVFTSSQSVTSELGLGNFCLYHGDLSDSLNKDAALWLISKVFNDINTPLVIAGKNPGRQLIKLSDLFAHICLISNPSTGEMNELIKKAQINILPSFSNNRPELKLVHALLSGRHCITNEEAVAGTSLADACHVGKTPAAVKSIILQLYRRPFEEDEIELRKKIFKSMIKEKPVNTLLRWLYG